MQWLQYPLSKGSLNLCIVAKAILSIVKADVLEIAGSLQLCAGQSTGAEAIFHSMRESFEKDNTEAVLLIDTTNAFNRLNRQVAL